MRLNLTCLFWLSFALQVLFLKVEGLQREGICVLDRGNKYLLKAFL